MPLASSVSPLRRRAPLSVQRIQRSSDVRRAGLLYQHHDYAGALALVRRLERTPGLSEEERDYLARQQAICEAALDGGRMTDDGRQVASAPSRAADRADCGPRALALVCEKVGVRTSVPSLRNLAGTTGRGTTLAGLEKAAKTVGLKAEGVQMDRAALSQLGSPAIAWVDGNHYLAVLAVQGARVTIHDPNKPEEDVIPTEDLLRRSGGILLTVSR